MSLVKRVGATFVALLLTLTLVAPHTAHADAGTDASVSNASKWISERWETKRNQFFAAGTTADGVIALSAADQYPDTVTSMLLDLKDRGPAYSEGYPAGLAKIIMTADMAGQNPRTFYGCERDLVVELQELIESEGGKSRLKEYWGPHLVSISLLRSGEPVPEWVVDYLAATQEGGAFGFFENDGSFKADPDYTAVGISAMNLIAEKDSSAAVRAKAFDSAVAAADWSADSANQFQDPASDSYYWATYSSANSTGMLASSLGEVGEDIESPKRYLVSQQNADGGWAAVHQEPGAKKKKSDVMATTQAVLGVIGEGYGTVRSTQVPEMVDCSTQVAPQFTTQPESSIVAVGQDVTLTVAVEGTPTPTIKWQEYNGSYWSDIKGATGNTLTLSKVGEKSDNSTVRAVSQNLAGTRETDPIIVKSEAWPAFTTQPTPASVTVGETATFSVVTTGTPAPAISWQRKAAGDWKWVTIADATSTTLTLDAVDADSDGIAVRAVATTQAGSLNSDTVLLTVTEGVAPAFTTQPESTSVTAGDNATFTVAATGAPTPGITWEKDVNGVWTTIAGATGDTLALASVDNDANDLRVRAVATNTAGRTVSSVATLTVTPVTEPDVEPVFTTQPESTTVTEGGTATFTVAATGEPAPSITWEKEIDGVWTPVVQPRAAAVTDTLTLSGVDSASDGLRVRAVATNTAGRVTSSVVTLTVTPIVDTSVAPAFTTQPEPTTVTAGDNATFTVAATGEPTPDITWEKDVNGTWTAIAGATSTTLILKDVDDDSDGLKVRAVATNTAGRVESIVATLNVTPVVDTNASPVFATQPTSTTVTEGGNALFTVAVTGDPAPGITWEKDVDGVWTPIADATGSTLTLTQVKKDANGLEVRAVATNTAGTVVSDVVTLTVTAAGSGTPSASETPSTPGASTPAKPGKPVKPSVTPMLPNTGA